MSRTFECGERPVDGEHGALLRAHRAGTRVAPRAYQAKEVRFDHVDRERIPNAMTTQEQTAGGRPPLVVIPIDSWNQVTEQALRFALPLSTEIVALHVTYAGDTSALKREWEAYVAAPARRAHQPVPSLAVLHSPYRFVIQPIIDHVLELERRHPDRTIAVVLPELVQPHWYQYFLHNQRTKLTAALLLLKKGRRVVVVSVPWCLHNR